MKSKFKVLSLILVGNWTKLGNVWGQHAKGSHHVQGLNIDFYAIFIYDFIFKLLINSG